MSKTSPLAEVACPTLEPIGLGLLLHILPIGLVKPLLRSTISSMEPVGETTATSFATSSFPVFARMAAALSKTEGTDCSRYSVPFAREVRWGSGW